MKQESPTIQARRARLREWIDSRFGGSQSAFVASTGINQGELSGLLKTKSFGEKRAASLERVAKMPPGYLVSPLTTDGLGQKQADIPSTDDYLAVPYLDMWGGMQDEHGGTIGKVHFDAQFLRKLLGSPPTDDRLILVDGRGDSMLPTIQHGDTLLVDTKINHYDRDGLYLLNLGHGIQVKRLVDRGTSLYVCSDNPIYQAFPMPEGASIDGRVHLVNRLILMN